MAPYHLNTDLSVLFNTAAAARDVKIRDLVFLPIVPLATWLTDNNLDIGTSMDYPSALSTKKYDHGEVVGRIQDHQY